MLFLYLCIMVVHAYNVEDCIQVHGKEHTMCNYMQTFDKEYVHVDEFNKKYSNVMRMASIAKRFDKGVTYGLTSFSDRKFARNRHLAHSRKITPSTYRHHMLKSYKLPAQLDLREKMQPVKDQGDCGSCYVFAATAVLEWYAGVEISEQKLMDCSSSTNGPSYGCDGGWPETLFEYAQVNDVVRGKDQPYLAVNAPCNQTCGGSVSHVQHYGMLDMDKDEKSETRIPYMLNTYGPVVVSIDVGTTELLMSYQDGVFPGIACGNEVDHAVTIVGYTEDYWIVRNSWSDKWGDGGYFYLERGVNACGVASTIGYVSQTY